MKASIPVLRLKKRSERAFRINRHPWIFSGAIESEEIGTGSEYPVQVYDSEGYLGWGIRDRKSRIPVRILDFHSRPVPDPLDPGFWNLRFANANKLRRNLLDLGKTSGYRMINSEGDFFPGLTLDRFGEIAVYQSEYQFYDRVLRILEPSLIQSGITSLLKKSSLDSGYEIFLGPDRKEAEFWENGNKYLWVGTESQKTGFFLDQRDSRKLVGELAADKSVLNCFSYSGGFGISAMKGGANQVVNVDISESSLRIARRIEFLNFQNNNTSKFEYIAKDCFEYLREIPKDKFDLIILDPPAFTKSKETVTKATRGYKDINLNAMKAISKGGLLFTYSCSKHMSRDLFRKVIFGAGLDSGRSIRFLKDLGPGLDHPVNLSHPEGEYLKGLLLEIQ
jgi:23S rRNA (cytosine1962-C5)-methyltransferase